MKITSSRARITRHKNNKLKYFLLPLVLVIVLAIVALITLERNGSVDLIKKPRERAVASHNDAKTTSTQPSAQDNFSAQQTREIADSDKIKGTGIDTDGNTPVTTPTESWTKSNDGASVVAHSPLSNSIFTTESIISGTSTQSTVYFRLIDSIYGVIADGTLKVNDGKFSGKISFKSDANEGRLDIYNVSSDGVESNNVYIPVRFK